MASVTLSPVTGWTVGETISAYVRNQRNEKVGSAVATTTVASDSTTTFTGLDAETRFIATDGTSEVRFGTHTDPLDSAQSGSASVAVTVVADAGASETLTAPSTGEAIYDVTLSEDCTFTLAGGSDGYGATLTLIIRQGTGGGYAVTWPDSVVWPLGAAPPLSTEEGQADLITLLTADAGSTWIGLLAGPQIEPPPAPSAPAFAVDPVVSGSAAVGSTLTCSSGTVTGFPTPTETFQWQRDGVDIGGATNSTYVTQDPADVDADITCDVTADNGVGSPAVATSNAITVTASGGGSEFLNDTFTGTNATDLVGHTGETGATWTQFAGTAVPNYSQPYLIASNRVYCSGDYGLVWASGVPATAEYDLEADFHVDSVVGICQIIARHAVDVDTMYYAGYNSGTGNWELELVNAGTYTSLGTFAQTLTPGQTYHIKLQVRDATKKVFIDGVERISSSNNAVTAKGKCGLRGGGVTSSTGIHVDNLVGTDA